jgi:hypothetical protein
MCFSQKKDKHPVRLAYQPPANSIFLLEQTSHHQPANSNFNKPAPAISHQPNEQAERRNPVSSREATGPVYFPKFAPTTRHINLLSTNSKD